MAPYVIITTILNTYKCHDYSTKGDKVYFNSHAVNKANVVSIVLKDGSIAYENPNICIVAKPRTKCHHVSTLKGTSKCKAQKPSRKSSLPDVIEL